MSAIIANHSNAQRAAAGASIVARAGRRWGLLPYQVVIAASIAASIAANAVLRHGQSAAGAVAAARRAARAQAGAA